MKTSTEIIQLKISDPTWSPKPHLYGKWFIDKLLDMGFYWEDGQPPHLKVRSGNIIVLTSSYSNVVIVYLQHTADPAHLTELYCHSLIPQNESEFDEFWNQKYEI